MAKLEQIDVLKYQQGRKSQSTVRRHYMKWRTEQNPPLPERCDSSACYFYANPPIWNGGKLKLILDHKNGVNGDNRPKNIQLLCPNCNSQQPTHGGGNKHRVIQSAGGFAQVQADGKKHYTLPAETGYYSIRTGIIKKGKNA